MGRLNDFIGTRGTFVSPYAAAYEGAVQSEERHRRRRSENLELIEQYKRTNPDASVDEMMNFISGIAPGDGRLQRALPTRDAVTKMIKERDEQRSLAERNAQIEGLLNEQRMSNVFDDAFSRLSVSAVDPMQAISQFEAEYGENELAKSWVERMKSSGALTDRFNTVRLQKADTETTRILNRAKEFGWDKGVIEAELSNSTLGADMKNAIREKVKIEFDKSLRQTAREEIDYALSTVGSLIEIGANVPTVQDILKRAGVRDEASEAYLEVARPLYEERLRARSAASVQPGIEKIISSQDFATSMATGDRDSVEHFIDLQTVTMTDEQREVVKKTVMDHFDASSPKAQQRAYEQAELSSVRPAQELLEDKYQSKLSNLDQTSSAVAVMLGFDPGQNDGKLVINTIAHLAQNTASSPYELLPVLRANPELIDVNAENFNPDTSLLQITLNTDFEIQTAQERAASEARESASRFIPASIYDAPENQKRRLDEIESEFGRLKSRLETTSSSISEQVDEDSLRQFANDLEDLQELVVLAAAEEDSGADMAEAIAQFYEQTRSFVDEIVQKEREARKVEAEAQVIAEEPEQLSPYMQRLRESPVF